MRLVRRIHLPRELRHKIDSKSSFDTCVSQKRMSLSTASDAARSVIKSVFVPTHRIGRKRVCIGSSTCLIFHSAATISESSDEMRFTPSHSQCEPSAWTKSQRGRVGSGAAASESRLSDAVTTGTAIPTSCGTTAPVYMDSIRPGDHTGKSRSGKRTPRALFA